MKQLSIFIVLIVAASVWAVTVSDVQDVKQRTEGGNLNLSPAERSVIEEFWESRLNTMLISDRPDDIIAIRKDLEVAMGDEPLSLYSSAYNEIAREYLAKALENVVRVEDTNKQEMLEQNLMVLTARLKSPALASIAIQRIDHENPVVRYWAVKAVTNTGVIQMLSSDVTADKETEGKILNVLKQRLQFEQQTEIRTMIVNFAAAMEHPTAREILLTVADERIKAYTTWSFMMDQETLDTRLLIALGSRATTAENNEDKSVLARKFAELYALVFQAYMKGAGSLDAAQLSYLLTVILEVDRSILNQMLNVPQTGVLRAIQRQVGLEREYEMIFGDRLRPGDLATTFRFDYGKDASGRSITAPPEIGSVPETLQPAQ